MKYNNDLISINQMVFILMLTMVGTGILTLPRNLAEAAPYDHWTILLAGGLVAAITTMVYTAIIKLKPGQKYFDILCAALTKPIGYIVGIVCVIYYMGTVGLLLRLFGEVIKVYLLNTTPIEVINASLLLSCIYLCRKGIEVLGRFITLLFPLIIVITIVIFTLSFVKTDFRNLLPVFEISYSEIIKGIPVTILSYIGLEMLLFFSPNLDKPNKSARALIAILAVMLFYLLIVVATFAQFGPIQIKYLVWPTLDLFDTIEIPGLFIENIQVLVMSTWVITVFTTLAPMYLAGVTMLSSITASKDHSYLVAPLLPFIYFFSLVPKNLAHLYLIVDMYNRYFASIIIFLIPLIVLMSLAIQEKLKKGVGSNE